MVDGSLSYSDIFTSVFTEQQLVSGVHPISPLPKQKFTTVPMEIYNYVEQTTLFVKYKQILDVGCELSTAAVLIYMSFTAHSYFSLLVSRTNGVQMMYNVLDSWSGSF